MAVGCSHGPMADPIALEQALSFKREWKPDVVMHLGDFCDFAALRSGAKGGPDESEPLSADIQAGTEFLERYEPTHIFDGNHEERIYRLLNHPNAIVSHCAGKLLAELNDLAAKLKAERIEYDIDRGWKRFGNTLFGHGYMYNQQAIRDHAETFGNCVIAHLHRVGSERGRGLNGPVGHCVGYLGERQKFGYAKTQRARLAWSQGLGWGEYNDQHTIVRIETLGQYWRSPL